MSATLCAVVVDSRGRLIQSHYEISSSIYWNSCDKTPFIKSLYLLYLCVLVFHFILFSYQYFTRVQLALTHNMGTPFLMQIPSGAVPQLYNAVTR